MPGAIAGLDDRYLSGLNGKPAALVTRLEGKQVENPSAADCAELGGLLARMHLAARSYGAYLENPRGPEMVARRSGRRPAVPRCAARGPAR